MEIQFQQVDEGTFDLWFELNYQMTEELEDQPLDKSVYTNLRADALSDNPPFRGFLVYDGDDLAGYFTLKNDYSTWTAKPVLFLEDLYLKKEFRGKGLGTEIFGYCRELAEEMGCGRFDWITGRDNLKAQKFYEKMGAERLDKYMYRIKL